MQGVLSASKRTVQRIPAPGFGGLLSAYSTPLRQTAKHTAKTLKEKNLAIWAVCPKTRRICHFFEVSQSTPPSCFILAMCSQTKGNVPMADRQGRFWRDVPTLRPLGGRPWCLPSQPTDGDR